MITLKQLVASQEYTNEKDIELIYHWFTENKQENVALSMIPRLAQNQYDRISDKYNYICSNLPTIQEPQGDFTKKEKADLIIIVQIALCDLDLKEYPALYEWAKEVLPTKELPKVFFMPTLNYLAKYGIYFKGREHLGLKQH